MSRSMTTALIHLTEKDRTAFVAYGVGPSRPIPFPIVHHAFEYYAQAQPHTVAVEHLSDHCSLTYDCLNKRANRLARRLRAQGVAPGHRVCILARRSIHLIVAIVAVLKSGAQYVPLDAVTITDSSLQYILQDSAPSMVLVMEQYQHRITNSPYICLESAIDEDEKKDLDSTNLEDLSSPTDGCYVIYTSGTTGVPKGVDVRHNGVSNVICGPPGNVHMRPGMRVAQLLNIAFDMGAWEILASLYNGCTLCLRGNTFQEWVQVMKTVHVIISTPSILSRHDPADYPNLKHVIVGGEVCTQSLADKWASHVQFNNCCGPTEISICNTVQPHTPGYPLSIGTPIPNTSVYILSRDPTSTRALPIGQVGCMWVGGIGVSRGYLNLPEKTAERWRPNPFLNDGSMMFNTGDLGRWRPDGQLEHHGRADDQVKVKGFRVELDGVASAMRTHPNVREAVALLVGTELWGFLTPANLDLDAVRAATAIVQPYYAVPSQYLLLDEFPMTRNGKIDKRALTQLANAGTTNHSHLSILNGGVPFSLSTPMYLTEQQSASMWNVPVPAPSMIESNSALTGEPSTAAVVSPRIQQIAKKKKWEFLEAPASVSAQS